MEGPAYASVVARSFNSLASTLRRVYISQGPNTGHGIRTVFFEELRALSHYIVNGVGIGKLKRDIPLVSSKLNQSEREYDTGTRGFRVHEIMCSVQSAKGMSVLPGNAWPTTFGKRCASKSLVLYPFESIL